jgi:hypothetical protein
MSETALVAGGISIMPPSAENMQLSMLLWGDSGSGKTTLAATAPGTKLYLLFDPGGDLSLAGRVDVLVLDLSSESSTKVMAQFRAADPYNLGKILQERPDIETVVVDSMTALSYVALQEAVARAGGSKISIEQPGMQGYTYRNALMLRITVAIMRICSLHKKHLILVTHEGNADRNTEGVITSVTMALSDGVANQVGLRFNEVWHVTDTGTEHRIAVRPCRLRKPMKTRLFSADKPEFEWRFNPDTLVGEGIADWYHEWQKGTGKRLPLPTRVSATTSKGAKK